MIRRPMLVSWRTCAWVSWSKTSRLTSPTWPGRTDPPRPWPGGTRTEFFFRFFRPMLMSARGSPELISVGYPLHLLVLPVRVHGREQTRQAIRTHALRLFREPGFQATTVGAVACAGTATESSSYLPRAVARHAGPDRGLAGQ
jgi:hypothetical protein